MSTIDCIAASFQQARLEKRSAFVAYICGGDPSLEDSVKVATTLLESGVDILEIGVPFSDPLADGLTNQLASQRALEAGMTHEKLFSLVRSIREKSNKPIILYIYYNLIFSQGIASYLRQCKDAGIDGILALDCPPEEASELLAASRAIGLANVFIVAPTTPPERIKLITKEASGFIYYVSREGVTGERSDMVSNLAESVSAIKQHTSLPVVVGFGISTPQQVTAVGKVADGVVVGSALVNVVAANAKTPEKIPDELHKKMNFLLGKK
ncbi:MAG: tryptophan synthase subunit alpha [Puniceicoccales bacterium]|nr:tryptophan synthase subunit alpha [Puniceicoccales bacterium]